MRLTDAQRELLEDKFVLWDRYSREGSMELRDYNRRAAEALKVALAICSETEPMPTGRSEPFPAQTLTGGIELDPSDVVGGVQWVDEPKP